MLRRINDDYVNHETRQFVRKYGERPRAGDTRPRGAGCSRGAPPGRRWGPHASGILPHTKTGVRVLWGIDGGAAGIGEVLPKAVLEDSAAAAEDRLASADGGWASTLRGVRE
jgi:hypothetical protein